MKSYIPTFAEHITESTLSAYVDSLNEDRDSEIATTILNQIGGRALYMLGATSGGMKFKKGFGGINNGVRIPLGKNVARVNRLEITLNDNDLYDMEFYKGKLDRITYEYQKRNVIKKTDLFADQLIDVIEEVTGMYTSI